MNCRRAGRAALAVATLLAPTLLLASPAAALSCAAPTGTLAERLNDFADGDGAKPRFAFIGTVTERSKPIEGLDGYAQRVTFDVKAVLHGADNRTQRVLVPSKPPKFPPGEEPVAIPGPSFGHTYRGGGLQLVAGFHDRDGTRDASALCNTFAGNVSAQRAKRLVELADHATVFDARFRPSPSVPEQPAPELPTLPETGTGVVPVLLAGAALVVVGAGLSVSRRRAVRTRWRCPPLSR